LLIFYNGVLLGAVAAQYTVDGVGTFFLAWVGPHGVLELPAIVLAAAAGLRMGWAVVVPGEIGRPAAIREAFTPAAWLLSTSVVLLVLAGIIEGSFSQFTARLVPYPWKIATAGVLAIGLVGWLGMPRRRSDGT
ncbi:MAG TPA: stage II sporulation protein M, partial [Myxococcaceae bacterium]